MGGEIWHEYYQNFSYFSDEKVREGCEPRVYLHEGDVQKAIVLVHGLSDSPHFMRALAEHFHENLGYNVYLPLLHCHGLKEPSGMEEVELSEWKNNVSWSIEKAEEHVQTISIGGLSTGGVLSYAAAVSHPAINGGLYLFSAALDLFGGKIGLMGELFERLLLLPWIETLNDSSAPLVVPEKLYCYDRVDIDGAKELARLISETDSISRSYGLERKFPKPIFAAHSECDETADIEGILSLQEKCRPEKFTFFRISESEEVPHPSVVLKEAIFDATNSDRVLNKANSQFGAMLDAIDEFEQRHFG